MALFNISGSWCEADPCKSHLTYHYYSVDVEDKILRSFRANSHAER